MYYDRAIILIVFIPARATRRLCLGPRCVLAALATLVTAISGLATTLAYFM